MNDKDREAIGLLRHQIISPVLMESGRAQARYFQKAAEKEYEVPGLGRKRFSPSTMKGWLNRYRKLGFEGIMPRSRQDRGILRRLSSSEVQKVLELREEWECLKVSPFYQKCLKEDLLGNPPICEGTLRRFLKKQGLFSKSTPQPRKRYEMSFFGELWVADFMHGPRVYSDAASQKKRKAILLAIIDDFSRVIVSSQFALTENTLALERVFKEGLIKFGVPRKVYVDNGSAFSSHYLAKACARLGVALVHSKPYDSPSRGKVERFFRTLRDGFLAPLPQKTLRLSELNDNLKIWIRQYHHRKHSGIATRPIDRYRRSIHSHPLKRVDEEVLEEHFLATLVRTVKKDATVVFKNVVYEVPYRFIGQKVELRYQQDRPMELYLYEDNKRVGKIKPVDIKANAKSYRPRKDNSTIPFKEIYGD